MTLPRIGMLTLTWNRLRLTKESILTARKKAGIPFHHLVVDNGSTDGTREWLRKQFGKGELEGVILNHSNRGVIGGHSVAYHYLKEYEYFIRIEDDTKFLTNDWLKIAIQIMDSLKGKAVLGCRTIGLKNAQVVDKTLKIAGYSVSRSNWFGGFLLMPRRVWALIQRDETASARYWGFNEVIGRIAREQKMFTGIIEDVKVYHHSEDQIKEFKQHEKDKQYAHFHNWHFQKKEANKYYKKNKLIKKMK